MVAVWETLSEGCDAGDIALAPRRFSIETVKSFWGWGHFELGGRGEDMDGMSLSGLEMMYISLNDGLAGHG
jgi:hypothetical protein